MKAREQSRFQGHATVAKSEVNNGKLPPIYTYGIVNVVIEEVQLNFLFFFANSKRKRKRVEYCSEQSH